MLIRAKSLIGILIVGDITLTKALELHQKMWEIRLFELSASRLYKEVRCLASSIYQLGRKLAQLELASR